MGAEAGLVLAGAGLVGGMLGSVGEYESGTQQRNAYEFDAEIATQRAAATRQSEVLTEWQTEQKRDALVGTQKAQYAGRGVKTDTGSPIDFMVHTLANANLDIAILGYNAEVASRVFESQADMDRYYGKMAEREGKTKASMSLLSSVTDFGIALLG